ncbi:MAG: DUF4338 domain-containing protein, partial [Proteobacteria bacterium]|nr:DUF4338 domain-containing protein [Pseudomonadota bacterium]
TPIEDSIGNILPIRLEQVRRTRSEAIFNGLVEQFHYLGYTQPVGEHLKYIAYASDRPIACLAWGSAPWYIGARDRYIGWSGETRKRSLHLIASNTRFLILPWIRVPCLASRLLALNRRRLSEDWLELYRHPIHLVETFVDTSRFSGTCYRADNWVRVGTTTGLGKFSRTKKAVLPKKDVYVFPLSADFKDRLNEKPLRKYDDEVAP